MQPDFKVFICLKTDNPPPLLPVLHRSQSMEQEQLKDFLYWLSILSL